MSLLLSGIVAQTQGTAQPVSVFHDRLKVLVPNALTLLMCKSSIRILCTVKVEISRSSDIALTVNRLFFSSMSLTLATLVGLSAGERPLLSSSSIDVLPSRNRPCHLKTNARLHFGFTLEFLIILSVSVGVFPSPTQNFITALVSTSPVDAIFSLKTRDSQYNFLFYKANFQRSALKL